MSIRAMTLVWERSFAKGSNLLLLLAIADYAKDDGCGAFPSTSTLARKTRMSTRAVWQLLEKLKADGEVQSFVEKGTGRRILNLCCVYEWEKFAAEKIAGGASPPEFVKLPQSLQTFQALRSKDRKSVV